MALKMKYSDGTFGMGTEWLHDFLFDRFRLLAANPLTTVLFRSVSGAQRNSVVLTNVDTNNKGDRVPTKQKWYLWALRITYQSPVVLPDASAQLVYDFLRGTLLSFKIENLDTMFSAPLSMFPIIFQVMQAPAATINSHFAMQDNPGAQKEFKVPLVLEENAVWGLQIDQSAASSGTIDNHFLLFSWDREMYRNGG